MTIFNIEPLSLPKIWQGRITKFWDRVLPSNFPSSSSEFSLNYATNEEKEAVEEFESTLGTEESPAVEFIGEGNFVSNYFGTYDVSGETGVLTLLSPEKVDTNDEIIALHYVNDEWTKVEDAQVIDGYVWGTLTDFSPIAIIAIKKEISVETRDYLKVPKYVVAWGNPVRIYTEEDKIVCENTATGYKINMTDEAVNSVIGGCLEQGDIESVDVTVLGVTNANLNVLGGSYCYDKNDFSKVGNVEKSTVKVIDSTIRSVTGGLCSCRMKEFNIVASNSNIKSHIGAGESINQKDGKNVNTYDTIGLGSYSWTRNFNVVLDNSYCELIYAGTNCGYTYVENGIATLTNGSKADWFIAGGSNGKTTNSTLIVEKDSKVGIMQSTNRGEVSNVVMKANDSTVDNLFIYGDATDKTVNGIVDKVKVDTGAGKYNILLGTQAGKAVTTVDEVEYVKVSRSADITISDSDKEILGKKFVVK